MERFYKLTAVRSSVLFLLAFSLLLFDSLSLSAQTTRNPRPSDYNPYATYTNGHREFLRLGTGFRNRVKNVTPMYDGRGNQLATAKVSDMGDVNGVSRGGINAGAMIKINVGGTLKDAVLCWSIYTTTNARRTGFVVVDDLKYPTTVRSRQNTVKANLANVRPNDNGKPTTHYVVTNTTVPSQHLNNYIYPNQTGVQNKLKYYYINNGVINLLVDLPYTTGVQGEIKGKAIDIASPGRDFYRLQAQSSVSRSIYPANSSTPVGTAKFLYGYVLTDNNEKVWCWINMACITPASSRMGVESNDLYNTTTIYPNPTSNGSLFVDSDAPVTSVQLFDLSGRLIPVSFSPNSSGVSISSDYLGTSMIKIFTSQDASSHKVIWE